METRGTSEFQPRANESPLNWIQRVIHALTTTEYRVSQGNLRKVTSLDVRGKVLPSRLMPYVFTGIFFGGDGVSVNFAPKFVCDTREYAERIVSGFDVPGVITISVPYDFIDVDIGLDIPAYKSEWVPGHYQDPIQDTRLESGSESGSESEPESEPESEEFWAWPWAWALGR
jgi:hypothetical protein